MSMDIRIIEKKTVERSFTRGYSSNIGMVSSTRYKKDRFWLTRIENLPQRKKIFWDKVNVKHRHLEGWNAYI